MASDSQRGCFSKNFMLKRENLESGGYAPAVPHLDPTMTSAVLLHCNYRDSVCFRVEVDGQVLFSLPTGQDFCNVLDTTDCTKDSIVAVKV